MIRGMFQNSGYFTQFVITLTVALIMNVFATFLAVALIVPLFGVNASDLSEILNNLGDSRNVAIAKVIQIILSLMGFLVSAFILAYMFSFNSHQYLSLERKPNAKFLIGAFVLILVIMPFVNMLGALNQELSFPAFMGGFEKYLAEKDMQNQKVLDSFLADISIGGLLINIFMIGIIPAVSEELFFRGVLQNIFKGMTKNVHVGIWISAIIFGLIHGKIYSILPMLFLGALFGYILVWSGSIWVPILAHFVNNTTAVLLYHFSQTGKISDDVANFGSNSSVWPFVLISALLTTGLLWYFYKNREVEVLEAEPERDQDS